MLEQVFPKRYYLKISVSGSNSSQVLLSHHVMFYVHLTRRSVAIWVEPFSFGMLALSCLWDCMLVVSMGLGISMSVREAVVLRIA